MSSTANVSAEAIRSNYPRVCAWLIGGELADAAATPGELLAIALDRSDDREFVAELKLTARGRAASGIPYHEATYTASAALITGLRELISVDGAPDRKGDLADRHEKLTKAVLDAISAARDAAGQPGPNDFEGSRSSVEASFDAIKKINSAANSSLDLRETTRLTAQAITDVMQVDECSVFILDEQSNRLVLHATCGMNPELIDKVSLAIGEGITGAAAELGKPIGVRDAWNDPRFHFIPGLHEEKYRSILVVPIVLFTVNRLLGVLSMHSREYRDFTSVEIEFVETAAGQLAMAMWNARVHEQTDAMLHRRIDELTTLQRTGQTITSSLDYREVLDSIAHNAAAIIDADKAAIFELDEETQRLFIVAAYELGEPYVQLTLAIGEGVMGTVFETRRPIIVANALDDPRLAVSRDLIHQEGYRSMLCVPLIARGNVLGGISVYSNEFHEFSLNELNLVQAFADQAAIAMENSRLYQETRAGVERNSLLLQELHHRVKNNLQTVASLLSLQARHTESNEAAVLLNLSAGRIAGMVAVHDLLSGRKLNVTTIFDVVQAIMEMVRADVSASGKNISLDVTGDSIEIGADKAMVIGMVVNELIWNAIRHAFGDREKGSISIKIEMDGIKARLTVSDNGAGLPAGFDAGRDGGLGLDIIGQLATRDLAGAFDIRSDSGTVATVVFKP